MNDSALKQRKVSFTEKVDYQDVTAEVQVGDRSSLEDSPTMVEEGMNPSSIFDSCDEDSDCELLTQVCCLLSIIRMNHPTLQLYALQSKIVQQSLPPSLSNLNTD